MSQYDYDDNEYRAVRDGKERARIRQEIGIKDEWSINVDSRGHWRLCSATHEDDVELELSGNFSPEQALRVALEICTQLNEAERKFNE